MIVCLRYRAGDGDGGERSGIGPASLPGLLGTRPAEPLGQTQAVSEAAFARLLKIRQNRIPYIITVYHVLFSKQI